MPLRELPKEWEVKKVEDILILKGGSTPSTNNDKYWNGMIPWVVPTDVTKLKSKFIKNTERKITKDGLLNCSATLLPKGSILLTSRATIGYLAINKVEMATNQGFINILPSKELFNIFLYYYLDYIKTKFVLQASGSTFLELSKNSFRKFCIPFPPLPEQHRIAEILSTVDETIERTEALIEKYRNIKKGLMADLLTCGIDEEGRIRGEETHGFKDSPLGRVPEEWDVKKISDILDLKGGSTPSTNNDKYWNGDIQWAVPTDITKLKSKYIENTERKITKNGLLNCSASLLPIGSILLTSRATIGFLAINVVEMATNQGFINILPSKEILNHFLYYYLDCIKSKFVLQASGSTFLELSKNSFKTFHIPFPPIAEQHRIAEIILATDKRIEKEEAYRDKLLQIKKGLMQDLLTGMVRVKIPQEAEA